ncbi:hypothetical protein [Tianweitania sediminis]|uniref:Uncharacterized protein n=1 Tax=Tianweitania sediminis TaxID=1502156 RepID=A0A8J7R6A9_9HYPH|nr:hypothetical protein [Tianweitania sediminis]MBP0440710.1 hypothetical protein [Tianweitania sediminis]
MLDPVLREKIEAERAAGFPDPAAAVALLFEAVGETLDPDVPLVDEADAWWIGCVELTIGRMLAGQEVNAKLGEIALWVDEWWDELRVKL